jgi:peptidoglycan hydrolase-like protein with peptidoglycan-binding domain
MPKTATQANNKSLYSPHPSIAMVQKWLAELKEKTGRTLEEWLRFVKKDGPKDEKARREWLKEQGLPTNSAWWIAERAEGKGFEGDDPEKYLEAAEAYVEKMFSGGKAGLRPIYNELLKLGLKVGKEAKACPCQTIVPLYRKHVFAQIKPTTQTRIDLGFALGDMKAKGSLIDTGGFAKKDRITHRIPISSLEDINDEVKHWLKVAYDRDA